MHVPTMHEGGLRWVRLPIPSPAYLTLQPQLSMQKTSSSQLTSESSNCIQFTLSYPPHFRSSLDAIEDRNLTFHETTGNTTI